MKNGVKNIQAAAYTGLYRIRYLEISQGSLLILAKFQINHLEDLILMFDYFLVFLPSYIFCPTTVHNQRGRLNIPTICPLRSQLIVDDSEINPSIFRVVFNFSPYQSYIFQVI